MNDLETKLFEALQDARRERLVNELVGIALERAMREVERLREQQDTLVRERIEHLKGLQEFNVKQRDQILQAFEKELIPAMKRILERMENTLKGE